MNYLQYHLPLRTLALSCDERPLVDSHFGNITKDDLESRHIFTSLLDLAVQLYIVNANSLTKRFKKPNTLR